MADESFLQPDDDTPVPINSPEDQMPGLAGYVKQKFEDAENGRRTHELNGCSLIKTLKVYTILQRSIVTLKDLKYLLR